MRTIFTPPYLLLAIGLLFSINLKAADNVTITWDKFLSSSPASSATVTGTTDDIVIIDKTTYTTDINGTKNIDGIGYARYYAKTAEHAGYVQCALHLAENNFFTPLSIRVNALGAGTTVRLIIQISNDGNSWQDVTSANLATDDSGTWTNQNITGITNTSKFYIRLIPIGGYDTGKYLIIKSITISGNVDKTDKTNWNKPAISAGTFDTVSEKYPVTITSEEGTTIKYTVGTGEEQQSESNSVTINVGASTSVTAVATGDGYVDSQTATYTTPTPSVATPTLKIGSYDYIKKGYAVTPSCTTAGVTLSYQIGSAAAVTCEGTTFYAPAGSAVTVIASKAGYTATSASVTLNVAPDDENSCPFQVTNDDYEKNQDHTYISYTIPGTYIAGTDGETGLKFRSNRSSVTKVGGNTIATAFEITVNEGYVIDKVNLKKFISNRNGIITIDHVYVDGVEKTFAEMGREDESVTMNTSSGSKTELESFDNLNARSSIIFALTNGTYGTGKTVDQFRAVIQPEYHKVITVGKNGYSTFAADYNYTFTGAQAYKAAYNSKNPTVVTLADITGVVPAGTGVIFKGTEGDEVTITKSATPAEAISDNALTGVTVNTTAFSAGTNYVLASKGETTAFVKMADGKQVKDMIGKAYLNIPEKGEVSTPTSLRIVADPTSVNVIEVAEKTEAAPIYNVAGQRVNSNMKGMLITGGKKYINK